MRGKLSSRPVGDVLREAEKLVKSGVQELLVISQDTSAYGADLKYAKGQWRDREYETRMLGLCEGLSELGASLRLHYVYPYPHVEHIMPLIAETHVRRYLEVQSQPASTRVRQTRRPQVESEHTLP